MVPHMAGRIDDGVCRRCGLHGTRTSRVPYLLCKVGTVDGLGATARLRLGLGLGLGLGLC